MLSTICSLTVEFERSLWSQVSASGKNNQIIANKSASITPPITSP